MNAQEVADLRHRLGVTQAVLGAMLGVHAMTVSKWECGSRTPAPTDIMRMKLMGAGLGKLSGQSLDKYADLMTLGHYPEAAIVLSAMSLLP